MTGVGEMPTADDYTAAASRFRSAADRLVREAGAAQTWDPSRHLGEGPVLASIDDSLTTIRASLGAAADHLVSLAVECDRRAEVCEAYRRAIGRYGQLPWIEQIVTPVPSRPAWWADA